MRHLQKQGLMVLTSIAACEPVTLTVMLWHKIDLFLNSPEEVSVALVILITS